jgi:hypothetical protein
LDAKGKPTRLEVELRYRPHQIDPQDLLDFIEFPQFARRWQALGLDDDDDRSHLELFICVNPKAYPVVPGTKGIRKVRYSPPGWNTGKSGALRVLYVYFEEFGFVALLVVYAKNEIDNISEPVKKHLNGLIDELERELRKRQTL